MDVGELIGGIMSGITRARRDADMTAAMIAEEYKLNSLLSEVASPRVRLAGIEVDLPVILNSAQGASNKRSGGPQSPLKAPCRCSQRACRKSRLLRPFATVSGVCRVEILTFCSAARSAEFPVKPSRKSLSNRSRKRSTRVRCEPGRHGCEKEPMKSRRRKGVLKQRTKSGACRWNSNEVDPPAEVDTNARGWRPCSVHFGVESRRIGREMVRDLPVLDVIAETEMIKSLGSDATVTRLKIKLLEEGLNGPP